MHAITLLEKDHDEVEALFKRFERSGDGAQKQRKEIVDQVIDALSRHAAVEEQFLYPAVRERAKDQEDVALEALEEHNVVKWLLYELDRMDPDAERFEAKVSVLIDNVRHHVAEERKELFPLVRRVFDRQELEDLGVLMEEARKVAPTRPHPRAPDTPPGNFVAGAVASLLDRGRDLLSGEKQAPREASARKVRPRTNGRDSRRSH